jgi:hypothetical protein
MTQKQALENLDTKGYPWKFKDAKSMAKGHVDYWAKVCQYFLELGGGYLSDKCNCTGEGRPKLPNLDFLKPTLQMENYVNPRRG